jgi:glycosyltransferase involved in cell wall biosynthesis
MMTAAPARGDAIGNYILSLVDILQSWDCTVYLYADHPNPHYPLPHFHSSVYRPTGQDVLWMHYSIYSDNVRWVEQSHDFIILDSHNVSPAWLFSGYDEHMAWLCKQGDLLLDTLAGRVDVAVMHTEYVRTDLQRRGYSRLRKLPLIVDTQRFTGAGSPAWESLLSQLEYLIFVGRIAPQKNVRLMLQVFAALLQHRPTVKLFLVGGHPLPRYKAELEAYAAHLGISDAVVFTGQISESEVLTSFYQHARFSLSLSVWESFCVPIIESLYFGTPVLGHAVEPIPETMGGGGVLLQGTPVEMAAQIERLWDDTPRYQALQHAGRCHVEAFTEVQLRTELLKLFGELATWE